MKKFIIIFTFVSGLTNIFSQNNPSFTCHTVDALTHDANFNRQTNTIPYDATTPYVINVFFTLLNDDESGHNALTPQGLMTTPTQVENAFLDCIKILNIAYTPYKIYFKYTGYQRVVNYNYNNSTYFTGTPTDWQNLDQNKQPEALNIFVGNNNLNLGTNSIIGGAECMIPLVGFEISNPVFHDQLKFFLIHEVAHNLSLYHTYETGSHYLGLTNTDCERVTRNQTNPLYNANFAGDEIEDTAAQPQLIGASEYLPNCGDYILNPNNQNCFTEPYENILPNNYMGYSWVYSPSCPYYFSDGQIIRMRKFIQFNTSEYNYTSIPTVRNDVSSLYEPFTITGGGGVSSPSNTEFYSKTITPNQIDTGINVWNCGPFTMRFQPGFDCEFSSLPFTVSQTFNDQFNGVCNGAFIGVRIPIFSSEIIKTLAPVCFGTFEPFTSGEIKSTANLGSTNYTVEELDKIKATDPELFEKLQSNKYHIITKETDSGYIEQKMIYKN